MDIELFFAVLKRFKWIVLGGLVLAIALAALAHMHRTLTFESAAEALITQPAAPVTKGGQPVAAPNPAGYAPIYVQFANADAVQQHLRNIPGAAVAGEVTDPSDGAALPFVALTATAPTGEDAVKLTQKAFTVLSAYINQQQAAQGIASDQRATLQLIASGDPPKLASGSSTTIPLLVFAAVLGAAIAIAFMLENARPQTAAALGRVPKEGAVNLEPVGGANSGAVAAHARRSDASDAISQPASLAMRRDGMAHRAEDGAASRALLDRLITGSSDSSRSG